MSVPTLRYAVRDRSILLPYYKRLLVEPLLPRIPARVDPNVITLAGHGLNLAAVGLLVALGSRVSGGGLFFLVALLVQAYLWCDHADGGHARRTGQCSARGEFLDHGLDLLNATYVACMTVVAFGAPPFWSFAAVVVVPAAAAVTYWEQAETGVFQLGLFNQIESIVGLTVVLVARGVFGGEALARIRVLGMPLAVLVLGVVAAVALGGIARSAIRVARSRGRLLPFAATAMFGVAITLAAATGALGTTTAIVAGAVVFVFIGIRQLTLRVCGERPLVERGVLVAAGLLGGLAGYRALGGHAGLVVEWAATAVVTIGFGALALARALEGHRAVVRLDAK